VKTYRIHVRWAWWLRCYLGAVVICSRVTGLEPDWERLESWIRKGVVVDVKDA